MYIQKTYIAGNTIEVEKTFSKRYGKKILRSKNVNPTPADIQIQNEKIALGNLRRLINNNFKHNDFHLVLTYRRDERPNPIIAKKHLSDFLRALRKIYKKQGNELKYIAVTEYGSDEKPKAIHHHLLINNIDVSHISKCWKFGRPHITLLDNSGDYSKLANYFIKETRESFGKPRQINARRWSSSKNLKKVEPIIKIQSAEIWRKEPIAKKGYFIDADSVKIGVSEVTGYPYQFYRMIRIC